MEISPPSSMCYTGSISENWKRFKQRFNLYIEATDYGAKADKVKTSLLLHVIGDEAIDIYNNFTYDNDDDKWVLATVIAKFEAYFTPKKNVTLERFHFNRCVQLPEETIDQYLTRIRVLSKNCEFGNLEDSLVKDRLVCGIRDHATRERLLREDDLVLDKATKLCKSAELVKTHATELQASASANTATVNAISSKQTHTDRHKKKPTQRRDQHKKSDGEEKHHCSRCDYTHASMKCPAFGKTCRKCGGKNHFVKCCKSTKTLPSKVHTVAEEDDPDPGTFFLDSVTVDAVSTDWIEPLTINGSIIPLKLDTGAQVNILPEKDFNTLKNRPKLRPVKERLRAYGDGDIPVKGSCLLKVLHKGAMYSLYFYIVYGDTQPILGRTACENLDLIKRVYSITGPYAALVNEYDRVFEGLGVLPGEHNIVLDETVTPVVHACRNVPFALHDQLKKQLDKMEQLNVIAKVNQPTDWVNSMVIVKKHDGTLRICLDPRDLNRAIKRQHYKMPTREEIMAKFSGAKFFSKLDASNGFWQLKLNDRSSELCTFNTPYGRYRYLRLPFGISSAPEVYHKTVHEIFENIPNVYTSMDDIIVWGSTRREHDDSLRKVFEAAASSNLRLNRSKCEFGSRELIFLGDLITDEGVKPDSAKVSAINDMETPKCKQDIQRFLGMVTYLAKWIPDLSEKSTHLRKLLEKDIAWQWNPEQEKAFQHLKSVLTTHPVLQYYDPELPIRISSDASQNGLGAVILQCSDSTWKPVAYASRALTAAETRYAQIEKELLSITFACERFHQFIYGSTVEAETDHKPLISIFRKSLNDCPLRVQRLLLRVQKYDLRVTYTPGKYLVAADTLSRATETKSQSTTETDVKTHVDMVISCMPVSDSRLCQIKEELLKDETMMSLKDVIISGWPAAKNDCPADIAAYWNFRDELSVAEGLILKGSKLVIPQSMRATVLRKIHEGHLGIEKCRRRARSVLFWPGINNDIAQLVERCDICRKYACKQTAEPLQPHEIPTRPWQRIGTDLFTYKKKDYLVVTDYFSLYPEVITIQSASSSQAIIMGLKSILARHGVPDILVSDNGPQYSSQEFRLFSKEWDFSHVTSSPHFPQSNGQSESAVKTVKTLLKKALDSGQDFQKSLLAYRSAPLQDGLSPSQLLMGRNLKTFLPVHPSLLKLDTSADHENKLSVNKQKQKNYFDRSSHELEGLSSGDRVKLRDPITSLWSEGATVQYQQAPRSYLVHTDAGAELRRNRRDLYKTPDPVHISRPAESQLTPLHTKAMTDLPSTPSTSTTPGPTSTLHSSPRRSQRQHQTPTRLIETC